MTVLGAKLGHGYVFMSQQNSLAPTFVTTCLLSKFWEEHGLDQNAVHLVVHTYGDRQRIPGSCNILGEPFNPPRVRYLIALGALKITLVLFSLMCLINREILARFHLAIFLKIGRHQQSNVQKLCRF